MQKKTRGFLSVTGAAVFFVCILTGCSEAPPDYDLYENMRRTAQEKLSDDNATLRDISADFEDYVIDLKGIFRLVFGDSSLEVHLNSYESDRIAVASLSQFEVPPDSANFTDFAFVVRPHASLRAPLVHGDALKAMAGMDGSFSMDFYNVNPDEIDLEEFFGDQLDTILEALELVEPYQRQGEDRGKYIEHLKDYTSVIYRIEIDESYIPEETEEAREVYYDAALEAYQLFMEAYFTSLNRLEAETDSDLIQGNQQGIDTFIDILYENDFAASLGKQLFGDDFDTYFLDGFWRDGYYGAGL